MPRSSMVGCRNTHRPGMSARKEAAAPLPLVGAAGADSIQMIILSRLEEIAASAKATSQVTAKMTGQLAELDDRLQALEDTMPSVPRATRKDVALHEAVLA